jgi:hypothetical protein
MQTLQTQLQSKIRIVPSACRLPFVPTCHDKPSFVVKAWTTTTVTWISSFAIIRMPVLLVEVA